MQSFGKWLFEKRKAAGFTQGQLAQKAGISTSYVSTLEREEKHHLTNADPLPKPDVVESLAKALGASVDEARLAAGYAPTSSEDMISLPGGVSIRFEGSKDWTDEKRKRVIEAMTDLIVGIQARDFGNNT